MMMMMNNLRKRFSMTNRLFPGETGQMRWGFIRKVYAIVFAQILLCTDVSAAMFHSHTLKTVMATGYYGTVAIGILVVLTFSLGIAMTDCAEKDPWNIVLLCIFTVALAFTIGLVCTYKIGMPIMIAVCVTAIAFLGLTLYTFWAAKRDHRLFFLGPFSVCASIALIMALIIFALSKIFLHVGSILPFIWGFVGVLIFCGLIIYYINDLATGPLAEDDHYIPAACLLFLYCITFLPFCRYC
ncbi:hypothetical protein DM860_002395 [Cuscuta australis]|uniref:Uncharacterized protein n=1 Tax=Cuscuta australis TaxID=267555 RepID=A0A328CY63_9ASTE|nr:hypothetical protein DM860_002395 [Cuscuta australis]